MSTLLPTVSHAMARIDVMPDSIVLLVLGLLFMALCAISTQRRRA